MDDAPLTKIADQMMLGPALDFVHQHFGKFELLDHWTQGEFHHDLVLRVDHEGLPGPVLVISTNCNGGIKEVLCLEERPKRWALWNHRCPDNDDFTGQIPDIVGTARTAHWFDPCRLLSPDARSELRPEYRRRQRGGGWKMCRRDDG